MINSRSFHGFFLAVAVTAVVLLRSGDASGQFDPETDQVVLLNTGSGALREKWRTDRMDRQTRLTATLRRAGVDLVEIRTDGSVSGPLIRLFDKRRTRR